MDGLYVQQLCCGVSTLCVIYGAEGSSVWVREPPPPPHSLALGPASLPEVIGLGWAWACAANENSVYGLPQLFPRCALE